MRLFINRTMKSGIEHVAKGEWLLIAWRIGITIVR